MKIDANNLPSDINFLHQLVVDLMSEVRSLNNQNLSLKDKNKSLEEQLRLLRAKKFGKSSEKLGGEAKDETDEDIDKQIDEVEAQLEENEILQAVLGAAEDEDDEQKTNNGTEVDETANTKTANEKKQPKRQKLPEHLERINQTLNPDPKCPDCGNEKFRTIREDISEILDYRPASFKVIRYIRPRCVCTECEKIVQAYPASKAIAKGMAGPGLLAHILAQKYCNHLPLYRQSQMYAREGIALSRSTMASWAGQSARLLIPLIDELKKSIFSSTHIHSDDTPVRVLAPGTGKTKIGRIWTYVRDGRRHGDKTPPAVCYFYSPDRKGKRPEEHLKDFKGVLHADAYSGYNGVYVGEPDLDGKLVAKIIEAGCWAHTRRKFHDITICNKNAAIANDTLMRLQEVYKIEAEVKGQPPEKRLEERQKRSKVLVERLFVHWKKCKRELPQKSSTTLAINYALNNEEALKRFLYDGRIEIDNNAAERAERVVALGRKNWLFAGSDDGGETAAAIYSLIETAKLNDINPWLYLKTVLERIQDHKSTKLAELLPWNLKLN